MPSLKPDSLCFLIIVTTEDVCLQKEILEKLGPERERERSGHPRESS